MVGVLGIVAALISAGVMRARESSNRAICLNNLRQIGVSLALHENTNLKLPPGVSVNEGRTPYPFMSWMARLLPFMEREDLWQKTVQAYALDRRFKRNPPHIGISIRISLFSCPSDSRTDTVGSINDLPYAFTSYLGVEGTNQSRKDGLLFLDSQTRSADISDGLSNTLAVGERPPSADGVLGWWYAGWGQSQDGSADMVLGSRELCVSVYGRGCDSGPFQFTAGKTSNQCDAFHFWSLHPGGAPFLMADGSGHFFSYSVNPILPALSTRSGGESISFPD